MVKRVHERSIFSKPPAVSRTVDKLTYTVLFLASAFVCVYLLVPAMPVNTARASNACYEIPCRGAGWFKF